VRLVTLNSPTSSAGTSLLHLLQLLSALTRYLLFLYLSVPRRLLLHEHDLSSTFALHHHLFFQLVGTQSKILILSSNMSRVVLVYVLPLGSLLLAPAHFFLVPVVRLRLRCFSISFGRPLNFDGVLVRVVQVQVVALRGLRDPRRAAFCCSCLRVRRRGQRFWSRV